MTDELLRNSQSPQDSLNIMSSHSLEHLSRELVRLCDSVEQHGLVDYQMGVAEEEIMDCRLHSSPSLCIVRKADDAYSAITMPLIARSG